MKGDTEALFFKCVQVDEKSLFRTETSLSSQCRWEGFRRTSELNNLSQIHGFSLKQKLVSVNLGHFKWCSITIWLAATHW